MDITLAVDDREQQNIMNHIRVIFSEPNIFKNRGEINVVRGRYEAADYIICNEDMKVLCAIERKSLNDYSSSIKDGRHENRHKMLKLREETNCEVYYIVEGSLTDNHDKDFHGIPYKTILSSMRKLQIIDDIHIIRTRNLKNTATELKFLCEVYSQLLSKPDFREIKGDSLESVMELCGSSKEEQNTKQIVDCWSSIRGISKLRAISLMEKYSLEDLIRNNMKSIETLRIDGRLIPKNVRTILLSPLSDEQQVKILSCIRGISKNTSMDILNQFELIDFLDEDKHEELSNFKINGKTKIGMKKINDALKVFKFVSNPI